MLEVRNLEKNFGPKQVLFGVDFQASVVPFAEINQVFAITNVQLDPLCS